jgi:hypothetical protein
MKETKTISNSNAATPTLFNIFNIRSCPAFAQSQIYANPTPANKHAAGAAKNKIRLANRLRTRKSRNQQAIKMLPLLRFLQARYKPSTKGIRKK